MGLVDEVESNKPDIDQTERIEPKDWKELAEIIHLKTTYYNENYNGQLVRNEISFNFENFLEILKNVLEIFFAYMVLFMGPDALFQDNTNESGEDEDTT